MRKISIIILTLFSLLELHSQTEQQVLSEANRLNISSREEAISALSKKGISESQAKEMAQIRGIDFEAFLDQYLKSKEGSTANNRGKSDLAQVVTELEIALPSKDTIVASETNELAEKVIENYFGYDIFVNNPLVKKSTYLGILMKGIF